MKIAIIGQGGSGKDTTAEQLAKQTGLRFEGSISWFVKERVAEKLGVSAQWAWEHRREMRNDWRRTVDSFRVGDASCIVRDMLCCADIISGMRPRDEFEASRHLFAHVIWVERDVPVDPTLELTRADATSEIDSTGHVDTLPGEVAKWIQKHL